MDTYLFASCILSSVDFFPNQFFFKFLFRNTLRVSNSLDPDQAQRTSRPDLGPSFLQRLSAEDTRIGLHEYTQLMFIRRSPPQFENRIMARVYVRSIMRSTTYQKAPFC